MREILTKAGDIPKKCYYDRIDFIVRTAAKVTKQQLADAYEVSFLLNTYRK